MACRHELCTCLQTPVQVSSGEYCSPECASSSARDWNSCRCGHAECREAHQLARETAHGRKSGSPGVTLAPGGGGCAADSRGFGVPLPPVM
jgi:hypothetical protein